MTTLRHSVELGLAPLSKLPVVKKRSRAEVIEKIRNWFFENFEDPAQETPYDGREGGYLYIHGGPFDTHDVIEEHFGDLVAQDTIELAIATIEDDGGPDWAPAGHRVRHLDDPQEDLPVNIEALHSRMLRELNNVESAFEELRNPVAGIGHNNPPQCIEPMMLDNVELTELKNAVTLLKAQPAEPTEMLDAISRAASTMANIGNKIAGYCAGQTDTFISEAMKSAGNEFGKWSVRSTIVLVAAAAALQWLKALGVTF
jgi:hypothetical protein